MNQLQVLFVCCCVSCVKAERKKLILESKVILPQEHFWSFETEDLRIQFVLPEQLAITCKGSYFSEIRTCTDVQLDKQVIAFLQSRLLPIHGDKYAN